MNKKLVREIIETLEKAGIECLGKVLEISSFTGVMPSKKTFNLIADLCHSDDTYARLLRIIRKDFSKKLLRKIVRVACHRSGGRGVKLAVLFNDRISANQVLNFDWEATFENNSDDEILALLKLGSPKSIETFRRNSVKLGEFRHVKLVANFQGRTISRSEINKMLKVKIRFSLMCPAVEIAEYAGVKLTEAELVESIKYEIDEYVWWGAFCAMRHLGRGATDEELKIMLDQAASWSLRNEVT